MLLVTLGRWAAHGDRLALVAQIDLGLTGALARTLTGAAIAVAPVRAKIKAPTTTIIIAVLRTFFSLCSTGFAYTYLSAHG